VGTHPLDGDYFAFAIAVNASCSRLSGPEGGEEVKTEEWKVTSSRSKRCKRPNK
jgi:hypothetical protein